MQNYVIIKYEFPSVKCPCELQGCKKRAHIVSWPEVVKGARNQSVDCSVS